MLRTTLILFAGLLLLTLTVSAQEQVARYEQEKKDNGEYFTVIPGGEYGILLVREDNSVRGRENKWILTNLDTDLEEKWTRELSVESKFDFRAYEHFRNHLYIVFVEADRIVSEFLILQIDLESGRIVPYAIQNELAFELTNIIAVQDRLVMAGYVRESPTILSYTVNDKKFDVVPGYFTAKSDIIDLRPNMDGITYNIVTMERSYSGYFLRLRTYSYDSDILFEREVQMRDNLQIIDGLTLGFVNGNIAIAGSYGSQNSNFIQGLYFAIIKPEGQDNTVKYHDFGNFEHFFDYTSPRRAERLEEKASEMSGRGKDMKLSLRLFLHNMIEVNGEYVLFAEVYDQNYQRGNVPYYYSPYDRFTSIYNPYRYRYFREAYRGYDDIQNTLEFEFLEAIVIGLSGDGDVKWDNSLVVEDLEQTSTSSMVDAYADRSFVHMLYKHEEEIVYKSIPYSSVPVEENWIPLRLEKDQDNIKSTDEETGGVGYWFNNAFYVWGFHRVASAEGKRNVIFINKVIF
ncbi:hypothetical protein [Fulvivirga sedimenti]|uniref:DUF5103 domain-containing protein n=1 Tax=Fulvivirga sedimenti TaxID=2879465 RepID=A0A9X1HSV7_9BACT|nr:hypothetical protein [Fulvivirga sedimenti]MCA6075389.1 hypothetical protein [Fulvivirga sedimenti]MCA6076566.1 hypothetical protein [Fulvivirga sedimenti]MCA6077694.1 hypothetical protein [Fulvivirga sedimenti]